MKVKEEFFYADGGMVASTDLGWIQTAFDMLTRFFNQVGLKTNVKKTAEMVSPPC